MSFVDEINIELQAGRGGDGVVRWRHEKYKEFAGPSGGNGGRGGDVYAEAVRDINVLRGYAKFSALAAEDGQPGRSNSQTGRQGEDLVLKLPVGVYIKNQLTGEEFDLLEAGDSVLLLSGGAGGLGNEHFKSSRNTTPKEATPGQAGERADFYIELRLIADAGLIGLPSAGKSTLLNTLTEAKSKTGGYPFTTLEPHLGDLHGLILADIPGLIDGAAAGRGLGHKFLRHIRRTEVLLHCLSLEEESDLLERYRTVRTELKNFDPELLNKKEVVILTKKDTVTAQALAEAERQAASLDRPVKTVSVLDDDSIKDLREWLTTYCRS